MLVRVIRTLRAAPSIGAIVVSIDDPAALDDVPELRALVAEGALALRRSESSPSRSVVVVLESLPAGEPVLVTTADHALLTPAMVEHFTLACRREGADVRVGLVAASLLRARYPESTRTYLPMRDDLYSGANLFAFLTPEAKRAAEFWVRAEALAQAALAPRARLRAARPDRLLAAPLRPRRRARAGVARDRRARAGGADAVRRGRDRRRPRLGPGARDAHPRRARERARSAS